MAGTVASAAAFSCVVIAFTLDRGDVGVRAAGETAGAGAGDVMELCLLAEEPIPSRMD